MESRKTYLRNIRLVVLLLILVALGCCWYFLVGRKEKFTAVDSSKKNITQLNQVSTVTKTDSKYFFGKGNFELTVPKGWRLSDNEVLPKGLTGQLFSLENSNTGCIFAYIKSNDKVLNEYSQTSFADRVFSSEQQFDSSWYVRAEELPPDFEFNFTGGRLYLPREIRIIQYRIIKTEDNDRYAFVLFMQNGKSVPDSCNQDASNILTSVKSRFDLASLPADFNGELHIFNFFTVDQKASGVKIILSRSAPGDVLKEAERLEMDNYPYASFYDGKLYFTHKGRLKKYDLFSRALSIVPGIDYAGGEIVNEFYFVDGKMFYLFGRDCREYLSKCGSRLMEYDFVSQKSSLLVDKVISRNITGYDHDGHKLYLYYADGDAGCFWAQTEIYDFNTKEITSGEKFSGCADGDGDTSLGLAHDGFVRYQTAHSSGVVVTDVISFLDGKLRAPTKNYNPNSQWNEIRYFPLDK